MVFGSSAAARAIACASSAGGGHDWTDRVPRIVEALQALRVRSVTLDGEGVVCGANGRSEFDEMRACFSRAGAPQAFMYAFDVLELDGRDMRTEAWARRREALVRSWPMLITASGCASTSKVRMEPSYSGRLAISA